MMSKYFTLYGRVRRMYEGPLGLYMDAFAKHLYESGYARETARTLIRTAGKLNNWLEQEQLGIRDLNKKSIDDFLRYQNRYCHVEYFYLGTFLTFLGMRQIIPSQKFGERIIVSEPIKQIELAYVQYLEQDCGLKKESIAGYVRFSRKFLQDKYGDSQINFKKLSSDDITKFVIDHAYDNGAKVAKHMTSALRSFLRFLKVRGEISKNLAACVPSVAHWHKAELPKYMEPEDVEKLLGTCNRETAKGRRDYAILLLLARLGLRAGEITSMELEDIYWEAGEIKISGKGPKENRMPLPKDVGEALAAYLENGRPKCKSRKVFICMQAPFRGFSNSSGIGTIVQNALLQEGFDPRGKGPHMLRHSLATNMLRRGITLDEIGSILRHNSMRTTEIYAKVDLASLRELAPPWPGGVS